MISRTIGADVTVPGGGANAPLLAGRYRVIRQLGHGGMGSVWLAEDIQLDGKFFAVKMLPSVLVSNKRAYKQLKDEALVTMRLTHPNIVTLRAFEENDGNPFLVMDHIDGETLDDYLSDKGVLTEAETLRLLKPVAEALDYAHGEGVVHRDVKPANVMIRKDGHPLILDFGIAREIQETLTRVTGKLSSGTLLYMSPEQLNGDAPKASQDIYSFAAMVYECLKGKPPFYRGAIEDQIKNKQPEPLTRCFVFDDASHKNPEGSRGMALPLSIASSVMSGLAKDPSQRPKTCAAVLIAGSSVRGYGRASGVAARARLETKTPSRNRLRFSELFRASDKRSKAVASVLLAVVLGFVGTWCFSWTGADESRAHDLRSRLEQGCARVRSVSDEDGFLSKKKNISFLVSRVDEYIRRENWELAVSCGRKTAGDIEKLLADDLKRASARTQRENAEQASKTANTPDVLKHAGDEFRKALQVLEAGDRSMERRDFGAAAEEFREAGRLFRIAGQAAESRINSIIEVELKKIRVEADLLEQRLAGVGEEDGFGSKKNGLSEIKEKAGVLYENKRWEACQGFYRDYVKGCNDLISLDAERVKARKKLDEMIATLKRVEDVGVSRYAPEKWRTTVVSVNAARKKFTEMRFDDATRFFEDAIADLEACISEAVYRRAVEAKDAAGVARKNAENEDSAIYAADFWKKASSLWLQAGLDFQNKDYDASYRKFSECTDIFSTACGKAAEVKRGNKVSSAKNNALAARSWADYANGRTHAPNAWFEAEKIFLDAGTAFENGDHDRAEQLFGVAKQKFIVCRNTADARNRQIAAEAAAKARAEAAASAAAAAEAARKEEARKLAVGAAAVFTALGAIGSAL